MVLQEPKEPNGSTGSQGTTGATGGGGGGTTLAHAGTAGTAFNVPGTGSSSIIYGNRCTIRNMYDMAGSGLVWLQMVIFMQQLVEWCIIGHLGPSANDTFKYNGGSIIYNEVEGARRTFNPYRRKS